MMQNRERAFMCVIHSGEKNERCPNVLTLDDIYDGWTQHLEENGTYLDTRHTLQTSELDFPVLMQCTEIRGNLLSTPVRQCTGSAT